MSEAVERILKEYKKESDIAKEVAFVVRAYKLNMGYDNEMMANEISQQAKPLRITAMTINNWTGGQRPTLKMLNKIRDHVTTETWVTVFLDELLMVLNGERLSCYSDEYK